MTTFKVRTIRSQGGSNDQASAVNTWTTAEDGNLDAAAGGQEQLLARAMSIAGAYLIAGIPPGAPNSNALTEGLLALAFAIPVGEAFGQHDGICGPFENPFREVCVFGTYVCCLKMSLIAEA